MGSPRLHRLGVAPPAKEMCVNDDQLMALVEGRLEAMGLVATEELVSAVIDIADDIASGEYEDDPDVDDVDTPEPGDFEPEYGLVAEEG